MTPSPADLYAMARQDRLFEASGLVSMRVRAEDAAADFDGTWRRVLHRFYPQVRRALLAPRPLLPVPATGSRSMPAAPHAPACRPALAAAPGRLTLPATSPHPAPTQDAEAVLQEAQDCNPANWDAADLANSNHVTGAKHSSQDKARLMRVLAAQPDVRLHLCRVSWALGYQPEPCRPKGRR